MAYDEVLAARVRDRLCELTGVAEKKMFGGLAFMVNGSIAVGVYGDGLLVRIGAADLPVSLDEPGVRPFDMMGGRPARGFIVVDPDVLDDANLDRWVRRGREYAATLRPRWAVRE